MGLATASFYKEIRVLYKHIHFLAAQASAVMAHKLQGAMCDKVVYEYSKTNGSSTLHSVEPHPWTGYA